MDQFLENELDKGEELLWSGKTEAFETLDKTNGKSIKKKVIITAAAMLVLIGLYVILMLSKGNDIKVVVVLILLLVAVCACVNPFLDSDKLKKATYALTTKRLIVLSDTTKSVDLNVLSGKAVFKQDEDGHYSLLIGKAVDAKSQKWRSLTLAGPMINQESGICEQFALYAVPEHKQLQKLLSEYITF